MLTKKHYSAPSLEEICDIPVSVLCESDITYTSPVYGGQDEDSIF